MGAAQIPWLLTGACDISSPQLLRTNALARFGECAGHTDPWSLLATASPPRHDACRREWRRAIAEELLVCRVLGKTVPKDIAGKYGDVSPFGAGTPPLRQLRRRRCAVAVIPLDSGNNSPTCAHLWLVEDLDAPRGTLPGWQSLPASCEIGGARFAIHAVCARADNGDIVGESYELALKLLEHALAEQNPAALTALALNWIVTGRLNDPHVERVDLGNKLALCIQRKWLVPKQNKLDVRAMGAAFKPARGVDFAADLVTAHNIITGAGPCFEGDKEWPAGVDTLHSFVSGAREPVIASALLTRPRQVVLWHSGGTWQGAAEDVVHILKSFLPKLRVTLRPISSSNLVEAQRTLAGYPVSVPDSLVLFNITQGNRLMSFAAQDVAQRDPNIWLVYRDFDADPFEFTMIRYEHDHVPHTHILDGTAAAKRLSAVNWDELFKKQAPRPPEPWLMFVKRISKPACQISRRGRV